MNTLTREKRKTIQVSLTEGSMKILESFTKKYGTSKSIVLDRALTFLAAQYHKKIYMTYVLVDEDTTTTTTTHKDPCIDTATKHIKKYNDEDVSDEEINELISELYRKHQ